MIIRPAADFVCNGVIKGTLFALDDLENPLGWEDCGNWSDRNFLYRSARKMAAELSVDEEGARKLLIEAILQARRQAESGQSDGHVEPPPAVSKSQATLLVELATETEMWHTPDQEPFVTVRVDDHKEHWNVHSKRFHRWLSHQFFQCFGKTPGSQSVQNALAVLAGEAIFSGPEHQIFTRLAELESAIYLDLSNGKWEAVEVTSRGWQVVPDPPVRFRRPQGMFPLPTPNRNGGLGPLRDMLNVGSDGDWALLLGWLVQALRPSGPYPILVLHGEQGSAKSTVARILRRLVDPNKAELRGDYREARDLAIAATNGWFVVLDNLSHLSTWLSDALCRLSTGGGFGTRMLYANDEEILFDFQRPIILTGIEELVTRGDTLDRAIIVYLPAIPKGNRRPEKAFWEEFTAAQSGFLGALLDAVSVGLSNVNQVTLKELPRMADFAIWCSAAEPGLPLEAGAFMAAYMGNRDSANELTLESSPVVAPLKELLEQGEWCGTATELLAHLDHQVEEKITKGRAWPKTPRSLSNVLRRVAANLRAAGIEIDFYRENLGSKRRMIEIRKSEEKSVTCVTSDTDRFGFPDRGDAIPGDGSELTSPDEARVTQGYMWSDDGVAGDASFPIDSDVLGCTCSDPSDPPIPADGQPDCQGCGHNQFVCPTCRGCRLCGWVSPPAGGGGFY